MIIEIEHMPEKYSKDKILNMVAKLQKIENFRLL